MRDRAPFPDLHKLTTILRDLLAAEEELLRRPEVKDAVRKVAATMGDHGAPASVPVASRLRDEGD